MVLLLEPLASSADKASCVLAPGTAELLTGLPTLACAILGVSLLMATLMLPCAMGAGSLPGRGVDATVTGGNGAVSEAKGSEDVGSGTALRTGCVMKTDLTCVDGA